MADLQIEYRAPDELNVYEHNARIHSKKQLKALTNSITSFGFLVPVLVDVNATVIAGHARLEAAKLLNLVKIPTLQVETLSETAKKAFIIADNKISDMAHWDDAVLSHELEDLSQSDFDLSDFGLNVDSYLDEDREENFEEVNDMPPIVQREDIVFLGDHVLICGDVGYLPDEVNTWVCELLITDPPYNCDYMHVHKLSNDIPGKKGAKRHKEIENDKMSQEQRNSFLQSAVQVAIKCLTETASFYIFSHADAAAMQDLFRVFGIESGFTPKHWLSWVKNNQTFSRLDYQSRMEMILYGWKKSHRFYGSGDQKVNAMHFDREQSCELHPTMKPVPLLINLIKNSSQKGDCVLDIFAGSGSTLIACESTGRKARCVEIDPEYCDTIIDRYLQFSAPKGFKIFRKGSYLSFNKKMEQIKCQKK